MTDGVGRTIDYLRISVTDKCNLRCRYCMPANGVERIPHEELLTLEEIHRIVRVLSEMGITRVRLTGGEPLVRKNLIKLVEDIHALPDIQSITMTTNGILLAEQAAKLREAGLDGVNISLDTLREEVYDRITGYGLLGKVLEAVETAKQHGLQIKINCVPCLEFNEEDLIQIAGLAREQAIDVRYIELMPVGCGRDYHGIPTDEVLERLESVYGKGIPWKGQRGNGPAYYYSFENFQGKIGFISPMSHQFCNECRRIRLTAEGQMKLCLHYNQGIELKPLLRGGASDEEIRQAVSEALLHKPRAHDFAHGMEQEDSEQRKMVQIGG